MSDVANGEDTSRCAFDEFKLYYDSTEQVTDRRLSANRWNYSISVAILLAIAAIYSWSIANRTYFFLALIAIVLLAALAATFCLFWLRQVEDWKSLNAAKFEVLSEMAARLVFTGPNGEPDPDLKSYRPFDKEWKILQQRRRLSTVRIMKFGQLEALNASGAELFMPRAFMAMFGVLFVAALTTIIVSWGSVSHHVTPISPRPSTSSGPTR
jgi:hypothetical protein